MRTKAIGTQSPEKTVWWKVDLGGVFNIYRINVLFKKYDESVGVYYCNKYYNYLKQTTNMNNSYQALFGKYH